MGCIDLCAGAAGQEVLLVTVPRFCTTSTAVLVNLATLQASPLHFSSQLTMAPPASSSSSPEVDK